MTYRIPGTRVEEVTLPQSVNISSTQRVPCFIGIASDYVRVNYEAVVQAVTGINNLVYTSTGIQSIISIGTQRGLKNILAPTHYSLSGDQLVFTSAGMVLARAGSTFYVSYYYDRPYDGANLTDTTLNDYRYKEFTNFEDVIADLGYAVPANPLCMIANLALTYYNVPKIAVVQVKTTSSADFVAALNLTKYRDVQTVCCLSTDSAVRTSLVNHVEERSLPDNGRYRMGWTGMASGTSVTDLGALAVSIENERMVVVNATRGKYYYTDPDTKEALTTIVDGAFIAAAIGAYRDSFPSPSANLLGKVVSGIELYAEDYDDYYSEYQLEQAGASSVFTVQNSTGGAIKVIDDLTTDSSTIERNNINIITAKDFIAKDVAIQLNRTFVGKLILNQATFVGTIQSYMGKLFAEYRSAGIIESIGTISATVNASRSDTVDIFFSYRSVYSGKYFNCEYALVV